jgi:predicted nucleotidyltransferase
MIRHGDAAGDAGLAPAVLPATMASMTRARIDIPDDKISDFCRQNRIKRLALFGSVLRDDFRPDSDVDVLVEFEPDARVGLLGLARMEIELSDLLGRKVDLNTPGFLSDHFRQEVLAEAEIWYDAA